MTASIIFLADGMADEPLSELDDRTPLEYAATPNMDRIAAAGSSGTFLTLPAGVPTSSDVANMSVLGYDVKSCYCGRGPLEALSQGIQLAASDIAFRCNLVQVEDDILVDYSGGHIQNEDSCRIMQDLAAAANCDEVSFYPGVSYRNLLVLHGNRFTANLDYAKPDASQGMPIAEILPRPVPGDLKSVATCEFLIDLMQSTRAFLVKHPVNVGRTQSANMIWPWSGGGKPNLPPFQEKYGVRGAIISAVDVIFGLGSAAGMTRIHVPGATGFVDTNFEGKAAAAVKALDHHEFVYVHVEAIDECGHMGDLDLKLQAIEDFDRRLLGPVLDALGMDGIAYAILPDHPVPVRKRLHTRTPVPFAICGPHIPADRVQKYSERTALGGALGFLKGDELMKLLLNR